MVTAHGSIETDEPRRRAKGGGSQPEPARRRGECPCRRSELDRGGGRRRRHISLLRLLWHTPIMTKGCHVVDWVAYSGSGGCGLEGDFQSELFELVDELSLPSLGVDTAGEVVVTHLVVGDVLFEHPPDDDEEVMA